MSCVDFDKIKELTSDTNGLINESVIEYAKTLLSKRLREYIIDDKIYAYVCDKIHNITYKILEQEEFEEAYLNRNGIGKAPGGFYDEGIIYIKSISNFNQVDFHKLVHEMLHSIADSKNGKKGLFQINEEEKYYYGYGFNEAATEYFTSIILQESFQGYSEDLNSIIQLVIQILNISNEDLIKLYLLENEWLTQEIITRFSNNQEELPNLVIEYDQRLPQTRQRPFNPNNVINIIINVIKEKIDNNIDINYILLQELLKKYYNYFCDNWNIDKSTKQNLADILDLLGIKSHPSLIKYRNDEMGIKLKYLYMRKSDFNINTFFETYKTKCKLNGIMPIERGELTEFEYFKLICESNTVTKNDSIFGTYYLVINGNPVTELKIKKENDDSVEIRFETLSSEQRKGYASMALKFAEQIIFDNNSNVTIHLNDVSDLKITSLIANKMGYTTNNDIDFYKKNIEKKRKNS